MPEVDYLIIDDTEVEPGAPILSSLGVRWRDNAIAIAQGASGAPRIEEPAYDDESIRPRTFGTCSPGTHVVASRGLEGVDATLYLVAAGSANFEFARIYAPCSGSAQCRFRGGRAGSGNNPTLRILVNGSTAANISFPDGTNNTFTQNISFSKGDVITFRIDPPGSGETAVIRWWQLRTSDEWMAFPQMARET